MTEHDKYCRWPQVPCACADLAAARAEARADERVNLGWDSVWPAMDAKNARVAQLEQSLADLRAKVEGLRDEADEMRGEDDDPLYEAQVLAHDAVLALIDEAQK